jgi:hypothetical protein
MTDHTAQGYKLVPVEPTEVMLAYGKAGLHDASFSDFDATDEEMRAAWFAMLAASPGTAEAQPAPSQEAPPAGMPQGEWLGEALDWDVLGKPITRRTCIEMQCGSLALAYVEDAIRAHLSLRLAQPAQPAQDSDTAYAKRLAQDLWRRCYKDEAPHWQPFDDLTGILTQIDNMISGLPAAAQPGALPDAVTQLMHIGCESGVAEGRYGDEWVALVERTRALLQQEKPAGVAPPQEPGCDFCRHPLFAALKCPNCGVILDEGKSNG